MYNVNNQQNLSSDIFNALTYCLINKNKLRAISDIYFDLISFKNMVEYNKCTCLAVLLFAGNALLIEQQLFLD